jgi:DNA-binding NarL/FixJ family response regulator
MRTLAVSDDPMLLGKLSSLLSQQPGIELVGRATTAWEALKLAAQLKCHLVITDFALPDMTGVALAQSLKKNLRPPLTVILFKNRLAEYVALASRAGADGYLLRDELPRLPALLNQIDPARASVTERKRFPALFGQRRKDISTQDQSRAAPERGRRPPAGEA